MSLPYNCTLFGSMPRRHDALKQKLEHINCETTMEYTV
jgi:hypothetical protein